MKDSEISKIIFPQMNSGTKLSYVGSKRIVIPIARNVPLNIFEVIHEVERKEIEMKSYIVTYRGESNIIDLVRTVPMAYDEDTNTLYIYKPQATSDAER